jgi:2'-5' RNA ligase
MRLFIAVDLDRELRAKVGALVAALRRAVDGASGHRARVSWAGAERVHVTLHFLGDVDDESAAALVTAMNVPVPAAPFDLALGDLGLFPARGRPRVVWLEIRDGVGELEDVRRLVGERLERLGLPTESHPFTPHLTLARLREGLPQRARDALRQPDPHSLGRCRIEAVTLYQSRLGAGGSTYTPLATGVLSGGATE